MFKYYLLILASAFICSAPSLPAPGSFVSKEASVSFVSTAKMQKIKAKSTELTGTIDINKRQFSFTVPICSFQGFFNSTQKRHYCEKYVEGEKYPSASFKGKIIEDVDMSVPGTYNVRAKGMFLLHGVEKETLITSVVTVKDGQIIIESKFTIPLFEYDIKKTNTLMIAKDVDVETKILMIPG